MERLAPPPAPSHWAVAAALLAYGRSTSAKAAKADPEFTPNPDANRLIIEDPFAFLLAVIFDQGIKAERAWAAPYALRQRLGHLDPARMAAASRRAANTADQTAWPRAAWR